MLPEAAHDWPLPYYWAHEYLPFFSKAYRPYRIGVVTAMCLAAMASIGAAGMGPLGSAPRLQVAPRRIRSPGLLAAPLGSARARSASPGQHRRRLGLPRARGAG